MDYERYIADALEIVSAWEVPPEELSQVVHAQALLMAGAHLEPHLGQLWPTSDSYTLD